MAEPVFKKQPRQSRSRSVVEAVVSALEQLIERTGDAGDLSMRSVARRAGVGVGSVYDYFNGQDGLFGAFLQQLTRGNFEALEQVLRESEAVPLGVALRRVLSAALVTYLEQPKKTRAAITFIVRLGQVEAIVRERDRFGELVAARIRRERPELAPALVSEAVRLAFDAGMGVIMVELWRPAGDVERAVLDVVDGVLSRRLGVTLEH
jgi:AcrR family transcriptional regulator